jgi:hypothetical protein
MFHRMRERVLTVIACLLLRAHDLGSRVLYRSMGSRDGFGPGAAYGTRRSGWLTAWDNWFYAIHWIMSRTKAFCECGACAELDDWWDRITSKVAYLDEVDAGFSETE